MVTFRRKLDYLMARQYGLIRRDQAIAVGLSLASIHRRLASGEWIRVYEGVYRDAAVPVTWHQKLLAACWRRPGRVWVSHRSAGALWVLDDCEPGIVEVTSTCDLHGDVGLVVHRTKGMAPRHVTLIGKIPVTTVQRTLIDLGAVLHRDAVEIAFESALRRGLTRIDRINRELEHARGCRGVAAIRKVVARHDGRPTESALETRFVQLLRRYRLPKPDRQNTIRDIDFIARVDFIYERCGVAIEVDGRSHHLRRGQWEADLRRRNELTSRGIRVLHVTDERMRTDASGIAAEIRRALSWWIA